MRQCQSQGEEVLGECSVVLDLGQTRQSSVSGQCGSKGQCTDGPVSGAIKQVPVISDLTAWV